jgi:hypothetical protein
MKDILIDILGVIHAVRSSLTMHDICLDFPHESLEVGEYQIGLQVTILAQEGLRIYIDLGTFLIVNILDVCI